MMVMLESQEDCLSGDELDGNDDDSNGDEVGVGENLEADVSMWGIHGINKQLTQSRADSDINVSILP